MGGFWGAFWGFPIDKGWLNRGIAKDSIARYTQATFSVRKKEKKQKKTEGTGKVSRQNARVLSPALLFGFLIIVTAELPSLAHAQATGHNPFSTHLPKAPMEKSNAQPSGCRSADAFFQWPFFRSLSCNACLSHSPRMSFCGWERRGRGSPGMGALRDGLGGGMPRIGGGLRIGESGWEGGSRIVRF